MTVRGKKPNVEAASAASPRKQSGKEQQQEFTKMMEQMGGMDGGELDSDDEDLPDLEADDDMPTLEAADDK